MVIHAAYGSSKDISVYSSVGLKPDQIFIVGKVSKKHHAQAQVMLIVSNPMLGVDIVKVLIPILD